MNNPVALNSLRASLLRELAGATDSSDGMSLPRLGKRLGQGASVLMRELSLMSDAEIGGVRGPGWVQVACMDDRWVARLTPTGRARIETMNEE